MSILKVDLSEKTGREIDLEVRRIINDCYDETEKLLRNHNRLIHDLAEVLLINETIDAEEMEIVLQCYERKKRGQPALEERAFPANSIVIQQKQRRHEHEPNWKNTTVIVSDRVAGEPALPVVARLSMMLLNA